jgi:hypothetical protein
VYSVGYPFEQFFSRVKKQVFSETILMITKKLWIHINNNKIDFLSKFESLIVLVLFKIFNCCISIFMSNILFCHGYTTNYVIMNGIKMLKSFFTLTSWGNARSPRSRIFG